MMLARCFVVAILLQLIECKIENGVLDTSLDWQFLTRFCFLSDDGQLKYNISYPQEYANLSLYLYYDTPDQWNYVYDNSLTCEEKVSVLSNEKNRENNQIVKLTDKPVTEWLKETHINVTTDGPCRLIDKMYHCTGSRIFKSSRDRWWYIAIGNCRSTIGMHAIYNLEMYNAAPDQWWTYQFSSDERRILETDIFFLTLELLLLVLSVAVALALRSRQMFHYTYKIFMISLSMECFALLCDVLAFTRYADDGVGLPRIKLLGKLVRATSTLLFLGLLVLLAKGWTITRGRLSTRSTRNLMFFMSLFAMVYAALYIIQIKYADPAKVLYIYSSGPGYCIIIMRIIAWLWFCYAVHYTLLKYPEKRNFYVRLSIFYSFWFWAGPMTIVLGNFILDNWVREKAANGIENSIAFVGFAMFLYLMRPSAANLNFPYHVRTSQIAVINEDANMKGAIYDATDLPHHAYQVQYSADKEEVFTVASARAQKEVLLSCVSTFTPSQAAMRDMANGGAMREMDDIGGHTIVADHYTHMNGGGSDDEIYSSDDEAFRRT